MKNKPVIIICIIAVCLISFSCITYYINSLRIKEEKEPICCIKVINQDEEKNTYFGLGYKIIKYEKESSNAKIGSLFMKYSLARDDVYITSLDDFYNTSITQGKDIRKLSRNYSVFDAQKNKAFIVGKRTSNGYYYSEFMLSYESKKMAYIRIAYSTDDDGLIIKDVLYSSAKDKVYIVVDSTRDKTQEKRNIELLSFEKIAEVNFGGKNYLVAYNGNFDENNITNEENVYIIATLN